MTKSSISKKRRVWILGLLFLLTLLLLLSTGKRGFIQQIRVSREKRRLAREIEALEEKKTVMEEERKNLHDPEHVEKLAREQYGMAKKNEKVYRVVPKEKE